MNDTRQKIFRVMGETGCYLFSIIRLAEEYTHEYIDAYSTFRDAETAGHVRGDCYIIDPSGLISSLTGRRWTCAKEGPDYQCKPGEFEILRFERQETGKLMGHFVTGNGFGHVDYDPEGTSLTVANGKMVSKRIFRMA